jgi:hypothetical protein
VHSIRTFAKIPGAISKCGRTASPSAASTSSATCSTCAAALALTARSIGRLLSGGRLARTALALLLACPEVSRQKEERCHAKR